MISLSRRPESSCVVLNKPNSVHTSCCRCGRAEVLDPTELDWSFNRDGILVATHPCAACGLPVEIQGMRSVLAVKAAGSQRRSTSRTRKTYVVSGASLTCRAGGLLAQF
jgi:hypothetical protein